MPPTEQIDEPILGFSAQDHFTIRDSFEGVQIFGATGSGKTTGSGEALARAYLRNGYGGLVLTAKVDETDRWLRLAKATGRAEDIIQVRVGGGNCFNFVDYESSIPEADAGLSENLVDLIETAATGTAIKAHEGDPFWSNEFRKLLRNAIDLLRLADLPLSLPKINEVVMSAATSDTQTTDIEWQKKSLTHRALLRGGDRLLEEQFLPAEESDWELTKLYWTQEYLQQNSRTRTSTLALFTGVMDRLLRGAIREIFCGKTTFTPEASIDGKIILLDLPQKRFNESGVMVQKLFKRCWQRAIERRTISSTSIPVFLWIDEAQHFLTPGDAMFQTTARSSRVATVLLTQNLPNYNAAFGGSQEGAAHVKSLLGNLNTKIFHNNTCVATNSYASELIGKDWQEDLSRTRGFGSKEPTISQTRSQKLNYLVEPITFTRLATGGPRNGFEVEGIVYRGGRAFAVNGMPAALVGFKQEVLA